MKRQSILYYVHLLDIVISLINVTRKMFYGVGIKNYSSLLCRSGEGNGTLFHYSHLENLMDEGA